MQPDTRTHLVVLFGGQSAEHDVSCTTAAHVLRAADPTRYRITPIGISRDGRWSLATDTVRALEAGPAALPGRLDPRGDVIEPTTAITPDSAAPTHGPFAPGGIGPGMGGGSQPFGSRSSDATSSGKSRR